MAHFQNGLPGMAALGLSGVLLLSGCQAEQRPGTIQRVNPPGGGSVSVSVSAAPPASGGAAALPAGPVPAGSVPIPVGLAPQTSGPTKSDGIYTPTTNREIYQKIATDYQEIVALTNAVTEGKPLPAAEILLIYEAGKHTRIGVQSRSIRGFARDAARVTDFPDSVAYYKSPTFLDTEVNDAIAKARTAANYTPAQQRQAIQKGVQRIIYHWVRHYLQRACPENSPGLVDEAWAIYVGEEKEGAYPSSIAATALSREQNFNRPGQLDKALREALVKMQKAATEKDRAACDAAANEVYSRLNATWYLGAARYLGEALKSVQANNTDSAGVQLVEGYSFYQFIQPEVAKADAAADKLITEYFKNEPGKLTKEGRDAALEALNKAATALKLKQTDLVTPAQLG